MVPLTMIFKLPLWLPIALLETLQAGGLTLALSFKQGPEFQLLSSCRAILVKGLLKILEE